MPAILLTPPAAEPISLAESKHWLRVEHDADDDLIGSLIAGARREIEVATRRALITQTWRIVLNCWPRAGRIVSPVNPLQGVEAVRVFDESGAPSALDPEGFVLNTASLPGIIAFMPANVMQPGRVLAGIEIDATAGHGGAEDVPAPLVQALRLMLAHRYEHRGDAFAAIPADVERLIAPFRILSL
jgi:uncharacterized phiE125 gp8 family phage protein